MSINPSEGEAKRRENRVTITSFLLFITLFAVIVPSTGISIVARSFIQLTESTSALVYSLQAVNSLVVPFLVITDPIVIMRNRDIREALSEIKGTLVQMWCLSINNHQDIDCSHY